MAYKIDLTDQVAVVTGAKGGIGAAVATILAEAGADIAICGSSPKEKAEEVLSGIRRLGANAEYWQVDLSQEGNGRKFVQDVIRHFGKVDIVVNNAALASHDWHQSQIINVASPCEIMEESAKDMAKRSYGRIVNISSSCIFSGGTTSAPYNATKAALDSASRFMAKKYAGKGILINVIAPGPVLTEMAQMRYSKEEFSEHYIPQMPIGRCLLPEDIAGSVLFMASSLCSAVCGETLLCDGGRVKLGVK